MQYGYLATPFPVGDGRTLDFEVRPNRTFSGTMAEPNRTLRPNMYGRTKPNLLAEPLHNRQNFAIPLNGNDLCGFKNVFTRMFRKGIGQ